MFVKREREQIKPIYQKSGIMMHRRESGDPHLDTPLTLITEFPIEDDNDQLLALFSKASFSHYNYCHHCSFVSF